MGNFHTSYADQLIKEIKATPGEYLPSLLSIVRSFRESITLKSAEKSFGQGWEEAVNGETMPVEELWTDIENDS